MFLYKRGGGTYRDPNNTSFALHDKDITSLATDIYGRLKLFCQDESIAPEEVPSLGIKTKEYCLSVTSASDQTAMSGVIENNQGMSLTFLDNVNPGCSWVSVAVKSSGWKKITIQLESGSTLPFSGSLHLEGSNTSSYPSVSNTDWATIPNSQLSWSYNNYGITGVLSSQPIDISCQWIRAIWVCSNNSTIKVTPVADDNYSLAGKSLTIYGVNTSEGFRRKDSSDTYPGFKGPSYNLYFTVNGYGIPETPKLPYYIVPLNVNSTAKAISTTLSSLLPSLTTGGFNTTDLGENCQAFILPNISRTAGTWFVAALGSKRVIMQNGVSYVWVSTNDGTLWTRYTNGSIPSNVTSLKVLFNRFVITKSSSTVIATSTDGITWTSIGTSAPSPILDVAYDGNSGTWTCLTDNYYVVSRNNLVNWSSYLFSDTIRGYGANWNKITCNAGNWIAVGQSGKIARCVGIPSDVNVFTLVTTGFYYNLNCVSVDSSGSKFLALSDGGISLQSSNSGALWNRVELPISGITTVSGGCVWDALSSKFVIVSKGHLFDSLDGIQWQVKLTPSLLSGNPIVSSSATTGLTVIVDSYSDDIDTFEAELIDDSFVFTPLPQGYGSNKPISTDSGFTITQTNPSDLASIKVSAFLK